jgi:drug/metabolite transporter (DMT)-like permease
MPMAVFVLGGAIDTTINYTNHFYLPESESAVFPLIIFGCAFFIGATVLIIGKSKIEFKNIVGGTVLGVINYFSLYYIVKALTAFNNDGAIVYPVLNVGIILMSSLVSRIIYKERLSVLNKGGLVMAVLAIIFIFYQEILAYY